MAAQWWWQVQSQHLFSSSFFVNPEVSFLKLTSLTLPASIYHFSVFLGGYGSGSYLFLLQELQFGYCSQQPQNYIYYVMVLVRLFSQHRTIEQLSPVDKFFQQLVCCDSLCFVVFTTAEIVYKATLSKSRLPLLLLVCVRLTTDRFSSLVFAKLLN